MNKSNEQTNIVNEKKMEDFLNKQRTNHQAKQASTEKSNQVASQRERESGRPQTQDRRQH